jgi:hypothetical protein
LNEKKNNFFLYDVEQDEKKVNSIMELKDDIKKCFKSKRCGIFDPKGKIPSKPFLCLIKIVYKEMDYSIISTQKTISRNNKSFSSNIYIVSKEDILKN